MVDLKVETVVCSSFNTVGTEKLIGV